MATTIPQKIKLRICHNAKCSFKPVVSGRFVVAILKMETGRNFAMSEINSGHHNLPTYEMSLKSDNVEFVRYCGDHFENDDR
jgi:hypothetical protein